jgi:hypothetical protein
MARHIVITSCSKCSHFEPIHQSCNNPDLPSDMQHNAFNRNSLTIPDFCPLDNLIELRQFRLIWNNDSGQQTSTLWLPSDTTEDNVRQLIPNLLNLVELDADNDGYYWSLKPVSSPSTT